jgi:hypothetical protein
METDPMASKIDKTPLEAAAPLLSMDNRDKMDSPDVETITVS